MDIYAQHADLYDLAFSWEIEDEIDWVLSRLGPGCRSVLEPGCGSGRFLAAFAAREVEVGGVDASEAMLSRARARLAPLGVPPGALALAGMADFDLGRAFDGAACPINTFGYLLTTEAAAAHLASVARHLAPGGRYLVQLDLRDFDVPAREVDATSSWEMERDGERVRATVTSLGLDRGAALETFRVRLEVVAGPRAGLVAEEDQPMRAWSWPAWRDLVATSPFEQVAAFDGSRAGSWPQVTVGPGLEHVRLAWHELVRRPEGRPGRSG